jgi:hypothetical protein
MSGFRVEPRPRTRPHTRQTREQLQLRGIFLLEHAPAAVDYDDEKKAPPAAAAADAWWVGVPAPAAVSVGHGGAAPAAAPAFVSARAPCVDLTGDAPAAHATVIPRATVGPSAPAMTPPSAPAKPWSAASRGTGRSPMSSPDSCVVRRPLSVRRWRGWGLGMV